jgi:hypothetical protein
MVLCILCILDAPAIFSRGTPLVLPRRMLGRFAEQMPMDLPKDLGTRIVEAARLAAMLYLQQLQDLSPVGGADRSGEAATDGARSSFCFIEAPASDAESEAA